MTEPTSSGISDEMLAKVQDNETEEWMERYGDLVWARIYKAYPWYSSKLHMYVLSILGGLRKYAI